MSEKIRIPSFLSFLRGKRSAILLAALLCVGAFLLFPFGTGEEETSESEDEKRLADLCSLVEGVGECRVYVTYSPEVRSGSGRVESVAIVCRGAASASVRSELTGLVSSLYGIGTNRISILKMKE